MKPFALCAVAAVILLAACASPGGTSPTAPAAPGTLADLPAPSATEQVLAVATVLEHGDDTLLCLGAVAESAPPQCSGPSLEGWDWNAFDHQESGGVRWAQAVAVEGTYDAGHYAFTQTGDVMSASVILLPAVNVPEGRADDATIASVQSELMRLERADFLAARGEQGLVVLDVIYDNGDLQEALDAHYGDGVVFVMSALR